MSFFPRWLAGAGWHPYALAVHIRGPLPRLAHSGACRVLCMWTCLALALGAPARTRAEPTLRVRAQVTLELRVSGREPALRVEGSLTDDLGARLTNRPLQVTFRGAGAASLSAHARNKQVRTDARGQFGLDAPCSGCSITVEFMADAYYEHASVSQVVASERPTLSLDFLEPSELAVSLDQPSLNVVVRASGSLPVDRVTVELQNELARPIGSGETSADGVLRLPVDTKLLGPYGLGEIVARVPANAEHAAARASKAILRTQQTSTELQAKLDARKRVLKVSLQLHAQSQPVAQRAVGVYLDKEHATTLITDERGYGLAELALDDAAEQVPWGRALAAGVHYVSASFQSDIPGLLSSESESVAFEIAAPARPSSVWLLVPVLLSVAFVLWSARRKPTHAKRAETTVSSGPEVRMGIETRGRSAPLYAISGRVDDVDSGQALLAAIELSAGSELVHTVQTTPEGYFESEPLPAGDYQARVIAPGYATIEFALSLPHQGALSDIQIFARSLRVLALDTYGNFAARVLTDSRVRGRTVRETLTAAVGCGKASPSVTQLAQSTEAIAYARAIPYEGDLHDLQRAAANALREAGIQGPSAGDPDLGW